MKDGMLPTYKPAVVTNSSKQNMTYKVPEILPVLLSPLVVISEDVFEYEKPTPTGESRNRMLATGRW